MRPSALLPVILIVTGLLAFAGLSVGFTLYYTTQQQASQRRAGAAVEQKICTTMHRLAALKPPAGNPQANPSRAYDQELHATLDQLGTDLGCGH